MQEKITIEDVENAFWNWQCWWVVAKSTGDIEDLRALTLAGMDYNNICEKFISQNSDIDLDERQLFDSFVQRYEFIAREEDAEEAEAER